MYAIASRNIEKAQAFAQKWDVPVAYGSYEEMVADPAIDLKTETNLFYTIIKKMGWTASAFKGSLGKIAVL